MSEEQNNDGGPAFPTFTGEQLITADDGMSLRDYFAAKAMQGLISGCYAGTNVGFTVQGNVVAAYEYADAMLKARGES